MKHPPLGRQGRSQYPRAPGEGMSERGSAQRGEGSQTLRISYVWYNRILSRGYVHSSDGAHTQKRLYLNLHEHPYLPQPIHQPGFTLSFPSNQQGRERQNSPPGLLGKPCSGCRLWGQSCGAAQIPTRSCESTPEQGLPGKQGGALKSSFCLHLIGQLSTMQGVGVF